MTRSEYRAFVRTLRRRHGEAAFSRFVGVAMVLMLVMGLALIVDDILLNNWSGNILWTGVKFLVWSIFAVYAFTCPGVHPGTMVKELLATGRCPSCAFYLASLPLDAQGLTCCPECSTRWRIAPPTPKP